MARGTSTMSPSSVEFVPDESCGALVRAPQGFQNISFANRALANQLTMYVAIMGE